MADTTSEVVVQSTDVHSTLEIFSALEMLGKDYAAVMADGKVDMTDLSVLPQIFVQYPTFVAAVTDAKNIPAEIKDLDEAEVAAIAVAALKAVHAFLGK